MCRPGPRARGGGGRDRDAGNRACFVADNDRSYEDGGIEYDDDDHPELLEQTFVRPRIPTTRATLSGLFGALVNGCKPAPVPQTPKSVEGAAV